MNTDLNFAEILKDLQYKPNWAYGVYPKKNRIHPSETEWWIRIIMLVENSRAPFQKWELKPIPQDEDEFWYMDQWNRPPRSMGAGYSPSREVIEIVGNFIIPPFGPGDEDKFIQWVTYQIRHMEDHETFEWLRYKGELIDDPHKEN